MEEKTLAQLDHELSEVLHAYVREAGSISYVREYLRIALKNETEFFKKFPGAWL